MAKRLCNRNRKKCDILYIVRKLAIGVLHVEAPYILTSIIGPESGKKIDTFVKKQNMK